jgi:hypothetical protein
MSPGPRARWALRLLPLAALVAFFIVTGLRGVDFGWHWDERGQQLDPTRDMVASGILLPRLYNYPTLVKWLVLLPAVPGGVSAGLRHGAALTQVQSVVVDIMNQPVYLLQVRVLFVVLSALTIVWVYGTALALGRPPWEAFVAAAAIGLAWEYGYQARWVTADCIMTQFAALTLFMLALFLRLRRRRWLYAAAIAVGLATGTKYQGVILLLPVLLAGVARAPRRLRTRLWRAVLLCGIAFAVYMQTTPGTLLNPISFLDQAHKQTEVYRTGFHGYSVSGAGEHFRLVLTYFAVSFLSPFVAVAVALFACAVAGAGVWARRDPLSAAVLLCVPIVFVALFCGYYRVVIVRNYLFLGPFLALLVGRGVGWAFELLRWVWARRSLAAVLAVVMVGQAVWLAQAAEGIRHVDNKRYARQAVQYVAAHPNVRFKVSPQVQALAREQGLAMPANTTADKAAAQEMVFFAKQEGPGMWNWKSNDPFIAEAIFGPREVNFGWYTSWDGHDRILVMTAAKAKGVGVPLAK